MSDIVFRETETGPFKKLLVPGHATVDAYDAEAGKPGACVEDADGALIAWDWLPAFHEAFTADLETLSGIPRPVDEAKTKAAKERSKSGDVKNVPASFVKWANQVKASVSAELWTQIEAAAQEKAKSMPLSSAPSARGSRGPGKDSTEKAESILTRSDVDIEKTVTRIFTDLGDNLAGFELERGEDGKPLVASLAVLVRKWKDAQAQAL